jgi:hypothetical protein
MRLALATSARAAQAGAARRLGKRAFHSAARLIHRRELGRLLAGPSGQERLVTCWRKAQRHAPPGRRCCGAPCPVETGLAGWLSQPDLDDRLACGIRAARPGAAVLALRAAGHDLVLPVDSELGDIVGSRRLGVPTRRIHVSTCTGPLRSHEIT